MCFALVDDIVARKNQLDTYTHKYLLNNNTFGLKSGHHSPKMFICLGTFTSLTLEVLLQWYVLSLF